MAFGLEVAEEVQLQCFKTGYQLAPCEVYENDIRLIIGEDFYISLNNASEWLGYWPTDGSHEKYWKEAKAGRFYIKLKNRNPSSIYWVKYRINRNQALSPQGLISLKNGRVVCSEELKDASGTLRTVILARTNSINPYITPLLRDYSLRIQEVPGMKRNSGKLKTKKLVTKARRSTFDGG